MTVYDSSVLIDYLAGHSRAVEYVTANEDRQALVPQLALFEVYQGEVFKSGPTDLSAVDRALQWTTTVEETTGVARAAAELQTELREQGDVLAPRDAFIAGTATHLGDTLAVSDADFDVAGLTDSVDVDLLR